MFPDCSDYVYCDCGNDWCSDECAEEDGFTDVHCKKYNVYGEENTYEAKEDNDCEATYCDDCENYVERSCKYCRGEDFDDSELLRYTLNRLGMTREYIIKEYQDDLKTLQP